MYWWVFFYLFVRTKYSREAALTHLKDMKNLQIFVRKKITRVRAIQTFIWFQIFRWEDGMGWDGMGWDGMRWDGMGCVFNVRCRGGDDDSGRVLMKTTSRIQFTFISCFRCEFEWIDSTDGAVGLRTGVTDGWTAADASPEGWIMIYARLCDNICRDSSTTHSNLLFRSPALSPIVRSSPSIASLTPRWQRDGRRGEFVPVLCACGLCSFLSLSSPFPSPSASLSSHITNHNDSWDHNEISSQCDDLDGLSKLQKSWKLLDNPWPSPPCCGWSSFSSTKSYCGLILSYCHHRQWKKEEHQSACSLMDRLRDGEMVSSHVEQMMVQMVQMVQMVLLLCDW